MLWQLAYTEIFFIKKLWPDFKSSDLVKIIKKYKKIKRNFGSVMIKKNIKERVYTSFILLFLLALMIISNFISTYFLILFSVLSVIEFFELSNKIFSRQHLKYFSNIFFITYLSLFCYLFFYFLNFLELKITLFILILGCISSDIEDLFLEKHLMDRN